MRKRKVLTKQMLIRLLTKIAATSYPGMNRWEINRISSTFQHKERLIQIRDTPWPRGLRGLIYQETEIKDRSIETARPNIWWRVTDAGKKLLLDLATNPDAVPLKRLPYQTPEELAPNPDPPHVIERKRIRAARRALHLERQKTFNPALNADAVPKHHKRDYDTPPDEELQDMDVNSAEFAALEPDEIKILRHQSGKQLRATEATQPEQPNQD